MLLTHEQKLGLAAAAMLANLPAYKGADVFQSSTSEEFPEIVTLRRLLREKLPLGPGLRVMTSDGSTLTVQPNGSLSDGRTLTWLDQLKFLEFCEGEYTILSAMSLTGKAPLYKTARLTSEALALVPADLTHDGYVSIQFSHVAFNAMHGTNENVFLCTTGKGVIGHFFERALTDFVL